MTASWTVPKTWNTGDPLTAADLNAHLRDNLEFLKSPPTASIRLNEASDYQTTSTSFVDVDASRLALTITTAGGLVLAGFCGNVAASGGTPNINFDVDVDGVRQGGDDGFICQYASAGEEVISFVVPISGLPPGSHTFKLQWKTAANTLILRAGAGSSSGRDNHPLFWVREVS